MLGKFWNSAKNFILVFLGMSGIRLDRGKVLIVWFPLVILSYVLSQLVGNWWLVYATFFWFFYYVGNTLILGTRIRSWLVRKLGEKKAYSAYEVVLGLMFVNCALAVGKVIEAYKGTMNVPLFLLWSVGVLVLVVSFGSKFWATWLAGLNIYYYRDLFLHKKTENFVCSGPYKLFKNPMYGVGYLYAYVGALFMQSLGGLVYVAICHVSIYIFYYLVERPYVIRTYLNKQIMP